MERGAPRPGAREASKHAKSSQNWRLLTMPSAEISTGRPVAPGAVAASAHHDHQKFQRLVAAAQKHPPVTTAIAHPCDQVSLESAVEAAKLRLIVPILVGPEARIREVAARN